MFLTLFDLFSFGYWSNSRGMTIEAAFRLPCLPGLAALYLSKQLSECLLYFLVPNVSAACSLWLGIVFISFSLSLFLGLQCQICRSHITRRQPWNFGAALRKLSCNTPFTRTKQTKPRNVPCPHKHSTRTHWKLRRG